MAAAYFKELYAILMACALKFFQRVKKKKKVTLPGFKALMTSLRGPASVARCLATATDEILAIQPDSKQKLLTDHGWRGVMLHLNSTFDIRSIQQINSQVTHGQMLWGDGLL